MFKSNTRAKRGAEKNECSSTKGISTSIGILIIASCALLAAGILAWQYWGAPKEEVKIAEEEIKVPEEIIEDETADWKTYRNEEYGFEVKYPENFVVEEISFGPLFLSPEDVLSREKPDPHAHTFTALILIDKIDPEESLEDWIQKEYGLEEFKEFKITPEESNWYIDWIKEILIGQNIRGYFVHEWVQAHPHCHYLVRQGKLLIDIRGEDPVCIEDPIFNQMLSTFEFLE